MLFLFVIQSLCIGKKYPGIRWGANKPDIILDVFCDPLCSDCAYVWPQLQQIVERYPTLQLSFHTMPLSIHTWSYHSCKAVQALKLMEGEEKAREFLNLLYSGDQIHFLNTEMMNTSEAGAIEKFCDYVTEKFGVDRAKYKEIFQSQETRSAAGTESVYSTIRAVLGTPTYDVNGVRVDFNEMTTLEEWTEFLDTLV